MCIIGKQVAIYRNYNLERETFHYILMKKYNKHLNIVILKMNTPCTYYGAKKIEGETVGIYSLSGKMTLPVLQKSLPKLFVYMIGTDLNIFY